MPSDDQSKHNGTESGKTEQAMKPASEAGRQNGSQNTAATADAVTMLKNDHREVEKLFQAHEKEPTRSRKSAVLKQITTALKIHAELEEKIFYPAVRQASDAEDKLDEAQVEHDTMKILISDLEQGGGGEYREAKVTVLQEYVKHHVGEEEASGGILDQAKKAGLDLRDLGQKMAARKQELQGDPDQIRSEPVSIGQSSQRPAKENSAMPRGYGSDNRSTGRERDERGRFTESRGYNDDDYRRSRSRSRDDDDDRRHSRGSRDDDDRGGRNGGSGWFGDSRGHSEAARRGWDERGGSSSSRSSRDYDDDRHGGSFRSSQGGGGRDRGQGGWFGDSEGHSEASRRGWDHREGGSRGYDDDDRSARSRSSSRYGDDDDDRRSRMRSSRSDDDDGRDHGRGGWFGDPRGHSEAARRGWDDRR